MFAQMNQPEACCESTNATLHPADGFFASLLSRTWDKFWFALSSSRENFSSLFL